MNSDGGILLIGVNDDGSIVGLEEEIQKFYKNLQDKFLCHFKDKIKSRIGADFYNFIKTKILPIGEKNILIVECKKSTKACYLDRKEFFVRTNPATDKLEGPELVDYIQSHNWG